LSYSPISNPKSTNSGGRELPLLPFGSLRFCGF